MTIPANHIEVIKAPPPAYISTLVDYPGDLVERPWSIFIPGGSKGNVQLGTIYWHQSHPIPGTATIAKGPLSVLERQILEIQNDAEEDAPPTDYAVAQTLSLVDISIDLLAQRWKLPRLATDGYGGLRLSWKNNIREIRAVITGSREKERYLYWEGPSGYGSIPNFTAVTLFSYLDELLDGQEFARARAGAADGMPSSAENRMP
jgi:hypothetical protein